MLENYVIFEEGTLPSLGKVYKGREVNPEFKIRSMTTEEEMRRLSHSDKPLKVICDIIDSCLIDNSFGISSYDMCLGDYQYLLHKLRVATYGPQYKMETHCPLCGAVVTSTFDLDSLESLPYSEDILSSLEFDLPVTGKHITLKLQTPRMVDGVEIRRKDFLRKAPNAPDPTLLLTLCSIVDSVDGVQLDSVKLDDLMRKLPMADTKKIMKRADKVVRSIGLNLEIPFKCEVCGNDFRSPFRITPEFYGPSDDE